MLSTSYYSLFTLEEYNAIVAAVPIAIPAETSAVFFNKPDKYFFMNLD